jgi:NitT/TauT family transport system ATP-binding protein
MMSMHATKPVLDIRTGEAAAPRDDILEFVNVAIQLGGREILSPTSLKVARGEFISIIGPSGCGKTTLLRAAAGFVKPTGGAVQRQGHLVERPSREGAFVFQDYGRALLPWRTVQGNVELALARIFREVEVGSLVAEPVDIGI